MASVYHINIFKQWFRQHQPELRRMRNAEVPLWQAAPKKWTPLQVQHQTSYTVVGGREAKKEKTTIVVQGLRRLFPQPRLVAVKPKRAASKTQYYTPFFHINEFSKTCHSILV